MSVFPRIRKAVRPSFLILCALMLAATLMARTVVADDTGDQGDTATSTVATSTDTIDTSDIASTTDDSDSTAASSTDTNDLTNLDATSSDETATSTDQTVPTIDDLAVPDSLPTDNSTAPATTTATSTEDQQGVNLDCTMAYDAGVVSTSTDPNNSQQVDTSEYWVQCQDDAGNSYIFPLAQNDYENLALPSAVMPQETLSVQNQPL